MRIDIFHHTVRNPETERFERETLRRLEAIMATLQQVLDTVTAESTKEDSIIALLNGIKQQLADALSGATLPPAVQAQVDAIFQQATDNASKLDAAIAANTPTT